jgi:TPR repeat protein
MLVSRANDLLNSNDFASARPLLRRAAEAGDAKAALMLGATYDPLVMHERGAIGIASDIAQARQWYEKAAKLGSDVATQRLANLAQIDH